MERYKIFFEDEFRQIKCGWRRVMVEIKDDKVAIQIRKGSPRVLMSRERFFALEPIKIAEA